MKQEFSIMLARFPGNFSEHPHSSHWVMEQIPKIFAHDRLAPPVMWWKSDTPITMVRNECVVDAIKKDIDFLLMIDSDMGPDFDAGGIRSPAPFFDSTIKFMLDHYERGPCLVAAPYCGPPPHENIYCFRWRNFETGEPSDVRFSLQQYTREEAAAMGGIKEAAALPTGLIMIDMRLFTGFKNPDSGRIVKLATPWFYYEWTDEFQQKKASTEDVTFSRDASILGCPCYVNWDAWALHYKLKPVGRPFVLQPKDVSKQFVQALKRSVSPDKAAEQILKEVNANGG